jgi:hypothetical protein
MRTTSSLVIAATRTALLGGVLPLAACTVAPSTPKDTGPATATETATATDTSAATGSDTATDTGTSSGTATGSGTSTGQCVATDLGSALGTAVATGTTVGAGNDHVPDCSSSGGAEDVTYGWTAPRSGTYLLTTDGSSFDTVLDVQRGDCASNEELDCDDDGGEGARSLVPVRLQAGDRVLIVVDGWNNAAGTYTLNITEAPAAETDCDDRGDEDYDDAIDCDDTDCAAAARCQMEEGYLAIGADFSLDGAGHPTGGVGYYFAHGGQAAPGAPTGTPLCTTSATFGVHNSSWDTATGTDVLATPACPDCDWAFVATASATPVASGACAGIMQYDSGAAGLVDFGFDAQQGIMGYYAFGFQPTYVYTDYYGYSSMTFTDAVWVAPPTFDSAGTTVTGHSYWSLLGYTYNGISTVERETGSLRVRIATRTTLYYTP